MKPELSNDATSEQFVFRVLSGPLNGVEFTFEPEAYLISTAEPGTNEPDLDFSERTIYIPLPQAGGDFIVHLDKPLVDGMVEVSAHSGQSYWSDRLALNQVCQLEGVAFAIKRAEEAWSDEVNRGTPTAYMPSSTSPEPDRSAQPDNDVPKEKKKKSKFGVVAVMLLILIAGGIFLWRYEFPVSKEVVATEKLQKILGDRPGYSAHLGNNGIYYLFAANTQQAQWAQQALSRAKLSETWQVVTPRQEEQRVTAVLERNNVAFFAIRFGDPANPTLLLSRTRNDLSDANIQIINGHLLKAMPYAHSLHIVTYDDEEILNKAEQGLIGMGFKYEKSQSDTGVMLTSWIPSADADMSVLNRFVSNFYQAWGQRYVIFSTEIQEDQFKDKSFKYGEDGYISMNKSHWLFNKKMNAEKSE